LLRESFLHFSFTSLLTSLWPMQWNAEVLKPIQFGGATEGEGGLAFKKLQTLLNRMMLRRTKVERADDLGLPPRVVRVRRDYFTEEEEEVYKSLYQDVSRKFNTYAAEGTVRYRRFDFLHISMIITDYPDDSMTAPQQLHESFYADYSNATSRRSRSALSQIQHSRSGCSCARGCTSKYSHVQTLSR
jgi:SNF2 family DNA or RNA helicase